MNQRFYPGSGTLLSVAAMLLLAACASSGSSFGGAGGGTSTGPAGGTGGNDGSGSGTAGSDTSTGTAGDGTTVGGDGGNANPTSGAGGNTTGAGGVQGVGGSTGTGGGGGAGGTQMVMACPAGHGNNGICHEFYANDNGRHRVNYVNEFTGDPTKGSVIWSVGAGETTTANSPRTIEIVDNAKAKSGKAVMVSLETGYAEFDTSDGTKLAQVTGYTGISGACRLPDGNTALGQDNVIIIVSPSGTRGGTDIKIPTGDNLRAINRNPLTGDFWFSKTSIVYDVDKSGNPLWNGNMGAGTKGYAVWWRDGGGAYATTGDPSTVIEMDTTGKILSTVGGKGATFPFLDFFSGFARLKSGHYVVANWLGHLAAPAADAPHVVEFNTPPKNEIVWKWGNQTLARQITNVYVLQ